MLQQRLPIVHLLSGILIILALFISCNNSNDESPHYTDNCKTDFSGFPDIPGWNFTSVPLPTEIERAWNIYFLNDLHGLVFSDQHDIWLTDDGSLTWQQVYDDEARSFDDITFLDSLIGFASAWKVHEGCLMKTTDGGYNWQLVNISPRGSLSKICFVDTSRGFAILRPATTDGSFSKAFLAKTIDGGMHWEEIPGVVKGGTIISQLKVFPNGFGFMPGAEGKVYLTHDLGETWTAVVTGLNEISWIQVINSDTIFVSGYDSLLRSTDGGMTWKEISKYFIEAGHFFSGTDGFTVQRVASDWLYDVGEYCNAFLTTSDGGDTWMEGPPSYAFSPGEINFINDKTGFILFSHQIFRIQRQ